MTTAPSKKRPWFQLHLSTCVVLMVVAGVGVWVNITPDEGYYRFLDREPSKGERAVAYSICPHFFPKIEPCEVYKLGNTIVRISYSDVALIRPWLVECNAKFGWPVQYALNASESQPKGNLELNDALNSLSLVYPNEMSLWDVKMLTLNAFFWLLVVLLLAASIEYALRRRERARAAMAQEPGP